MTNKIVILDDSVILYEHYISDDKWERTLAFPRGGLTYLVSNGTIKFYAYEDYFYRNCLISMQLPIYIVDEFMHIDGEYENIKDLTEVLDRIFPTNDMDAELSKYLKIVDAQLLYQPIGDYALKSDIPDISDLVTTEELVEALDDYYTKEESDARFQPKGDYATKDELDLKADKDDVYTKTESDNKYQPKGDYLTTADTYVKSEIDDKLDEKLDASAYTPCDLSNYYTKQETSSKTQIDTALARKADNDKVYTKTESDAKYQPKGNYALKSELPNMSLYQEKLIAGANITISGNVISASGGGVEPVDAYTKSESDARFQPKGDYATESWVLNKKYITSASTVFNNYYTTANTYNKTEINNYITQLQNQINSLQEALNECCSGTPTVEYRWYDVTSSDNYICEGTAKCRKLQRQFRINGGAWQDVEPATYSAGTVIEQYSVDCGYDPSQGTPKLTLTYSNGDKHIIDCAEPYTYADHTYYDRISKEFVRNGSQSVTNITAATIGDCANNIAFDAFSGCTNLQKINASTIMYIDVNAFEGTAIRTIGLVGSGSDLELADGFRELSNKCFKGCTNLTRVEVPSTCGVMEPEVFSGCTNLQTIVLNYDGVMILNDYAQAGYAYDGLSHIGNSTFKIYVPDEWVETYKSQKTSEHTIGYKDWGNYADKIYPISELNS